jgi:hypothetical protein
LASLLSRVDSAPRQRDLVHPAALHPRGAEHLRQRGPEPQRAVTDRDLGRGHPAVAQVPQQVQPRLGVLTVPVGDSDQFFGAVGPHAHHHEQTQPIDRVVGVGQPATGNRQPHADVDPVDSDVDVVDVRQVTAAPAGVLGAPASVSAGPSTPTGPWRTRRTPPAPGRSRWRQPRRYRIGNPSVTFGDRRMLRRQDRRREPVTVAAVIDPRGHDVDPAGGSRDLPRSVMAVADHQAGRRARDARQRAPRGRRGVRLRARPRASRGRPDGTARPDPPARRPTVRVRRVCSRERLDQG